MLQSNSVEEQMTELTKWGQVPQCNDAFIQLCHYVDLCMDMWHDEQCQTEADKWWDIWILHLHRTELPLKYIQVAFQQVCETHWILWMHHFSCVRNKSKYIRYKHQQY